MTNAKSFTAWAFVACVAGCIGSKNPQGAGKAPASSVSRAETVGPFDLAGTAPSVPSGEPGTQPTTETILGRPFEFKQLTSVIDGKTAHSLQITGDNLVMTLGDWTATGYVVAGTTVTFGPFSLGFSDVPRRYTVNGHVVNLEQYGWFALDPNGQALRLH